MSEDTMTITASDVAVLDLRETPAPPSARLPVALTLGQLKPGMTVAFIDSRLNVHPTCWVDAVAESNADLLGRVAMVVAVDPTAPGKVIALCLKEAIPTGHSCDGRVPAGHGAYALPEHLYTLEALAAHRSAAERALAQQAVIDDMLKGFV